MRYDCTKTEDYFRELKRMCSKFSDGLECSGKCPLWKKMDCRNEMHIAEVQEWSDTHPERTRLDRLKKAFPNYDTGKSGTPRFCPYLLGFPSSETDICYGLTGLNKCYKCWSMPDDYPTKGGEE